jgi:dTDP-glucose 4,6-dehydratase
MPASPAFPFSLEACRDVFIVTPEGITVSTAQRDLYEKRAVPAVHPAALAVHPEDSGLSRGGQLVQRRFPVTGSPVPDRPAALVTGGAGFLGSHLCEQLLARGSRVTCLDNLCTGRLANITHLTAHPHFTYIEHDVTQPLPVRGDFAAVFHLASPASPQDYSRLPVQTLLAGSAGTGHALDLARSSGARFILASSSEVYGDPLEHPQRESYRGNVDPCGPRSSYDEAKRFAEALTTAYRHEYGVSTAIARIFNSYGPRMRSHDGRAMPTLISQALHGDPLTVTGDGQQTRSFCYVTDTVAGLLALAGSGQAGPVNIGSTSELTILRLAGLIQEQTGSAAPVIFTPRPQQDPAVRRPDTARARTQLGWEPQVSLDTGIKATIGWFASQANGGS